MLNWHQHTSDINPNEEIQSSEDFYNENKIRTFLAREINKLHVRKVLNKMKMSLSGKEKTIGFYKFCL